MTLPKRKPVRLPDYDYSQNGAYFITISTQNKAPTFDLPDHCTARGPAGGSSPRLPVGAALRGRPDSPNRIIEKWFRELENKFDTAHIDKSIIMPNHIHFILAIDKGGHTGPPLRDEQRPAVQEMIDWFKTMTTNDYIRGVKAGLYPPFIKRLWQRGYYEHVIRNGQDYLEIWQYIEDNPVKWTQDKYYADQRAAT